jgi:Ricin-type beta-trefoil lectin domain-like
MTYSAHRHLALSKRRRSDREDNTRRSRRAGHRRLIHLLLPALAATTLSGVLVPTASAQTAATCTPPGSLGCLQITSVAPDHSGDSIYPDSNGDPHGYLYTTDQNPASSYWKFNKNDDSSFTVSNNSSNNCMDVWSNSDLDQWECLGQTNQRWFVQPYAVGSSNYLLRQVDTGRCVTAVDDYADLEPCAAGNIEQAWAIGIAGTVPSLHTLAVTYGMNACTANPQSCDWKEDKTDHKAYLDAKKCVSQVVQNKTSKPAPFTKEWSQSVGWENTLGGSVSLTVEAGIDLGIVAKVKAAVEVNYSHSWIGSQDTKDSVTLNLLPNQYGWITREALLKQVTGTWTLNVNSDSWTQSATITLPAADGTDGMSSVLTLHANAAIPAICS